MTYSLVLLAYFHGSSPSESASIELVASAQTNLSDLEYLSLDQIGHHGTTTTAMATPTTARASPLHCLSTLKSTPTTAIPTAASSPTTTTVTDIPFLSTFLSSSFSPTQFSSSALSSSSPASTLEKLQDALRRIDGFLRGHILHNHHHLLGHLSSLKSAESSLSSLRTQLSSLQSSLRSAREDLSQPHQSIKSQTIQLNNLHSTTLLLQHSIRILRLVHKLKAQVDHVDPSKWDLSKAAQLHCEIMTLYKESDLTGVDVVDLEMKWVNDTGTRIREEGLRVLEKGLENLNQPEVGLGLQVFYNMGELKKIVESLLSKYEKMGVRSIRNALDMKAISAGGGGGGGPGGIQRHGTPQIGGGAKAREALWARVSGCVDELHSVVVAVWHLQRVLSKKRDPFTHVLLLDEIIQDDEPLLTDRIWDALVKSFTSQMESVFSASSFIKETFTVGYPKLFATIQNLLESVSRDTDVKGVPPALSSEGKERIVSAIEIFQTAFLTLCLSRLSDLVNSVFSMSSRGGVPSKEQMLKIVSRIQEEIVAVQQDAHLTLLVLHEISKVLLLLAQKAEYQISTGPETRQVTGPATPAQLKNFTLCQHLQEVHARVTSTLTGLPAIASDVLSPALGTIYGVAGDSITPLFQSMLDRLESCILQIHNQNFGDLSMDSAAMDGNSSSYMEDLQRNISHFRSEFLSGLLPSSGSALAGSETICTRLVRSMASRVIIFFLRHASLVRPLSESGKLRLARDMAEIEMTVGQNLYPVEQLGPPYRALRAFRPVLFLDVSQLGSSTLLCDLPPSVVLHHLYSRGPDDLQSPLQRNMLSPLQYSLWMDTQGEDQIWRGVKATLDDYAAKVRARGDKEFSPVYPLMMKIGSGLSGNDDSQS